MTNTVTLKNHRWSDSPVEPTNVARSTVASDDSTGEPLDNLDPSVLREELRILTEVAAALSSSAELSRVLRVILTGATASEGLGFNRAFLFLADDDATSLNGHLAIGPRSGEEAADIWTHIDETGKTFAQMLTDNAPDSQNIDPITSLIIGLSIDLQQDSLLARTCKSGHGVKLDPDTPLDAITAAFAAHLDTANLVIVPMVSRDRLQGMLVADNNITGRGISDDDVHLLQILANQAAVAMERGRLYETQLKRAEELESANRLLAESQDQIIKIEKMSVIGELTAAVTHELRNPLTIVGGFANLMLKTTVTDEQQEYLNIIAGEVRRAESVLEHVLDFSKASASEHQLIDFPSLVGRSVDLLMSRFRPARLALSIQPSEDRIIVKGNNDHLSHAIYHIFKVVAGEIAPPCTGRVHTQLRDDRAVMEIDFECTSTCRQRLARSLAQVFGETGAAQHLSILVAGEAVRYHGGSIALQDPSDGQLRLRVELPAAQETTQ
jgi:signal transduction histidine kinase